MVRFAIRDVLWLMALLAVGFGWLVDRGNLAIQLDRCQEHSTRLSMRLSEYGSRLRNLDSEWSEPPVP
jgi:hypothetical protein